MAVNEQIVTGRKFRKLVDEATKLWQRISFWTKASDVEFDDGSTAETKMGAINGITDSLASTSSNIAASAKALSQLNNKLMSGALSFNYSNGNLYADIKVGADTVRKKLDNEILYAKKSITFTVNATFDFSHLGDIEIIAVVTTVENYYAAYMINGEKFASIGYSAFNVDTANKTISFMATGKNQTTGTCVIIYQEN